MCLDVSNYFCVIVLTLVFISIAKVLEMSADNKFRINGYSVRVVNNVISGVTFSLFLFLCYIYLFYV